MVPLKAVVFLERSESNSIQKLTFSNSFLYLLQHVYIPSNPEKAKETLQLLQMLEDKVSFYYFKINNFKEDCLSIAYNALVNDE